MLKIKDNVSLKQLEMFGFEYCKDKIYDLIEAGLVEKESDL